MPNFPKSRNGWTDDGREVGPKGRCPNCGSDRYRVTVSTEACPACGLEFNYWGAGGNAVYERYEERERRAAEDRAWDEAFRASLEERDLVPLWGDDE